ncbi:MAG: Spy/CpxP family protein refolding chaperone [Thermodesulfobacteriota bacterium]|nr:Spy/CpxP family protein refolding chaperone [Thermodesulfobacteriota bacterium]
MKFKKKHFIITAVILFVGIVSACGIHGFKNCGYHPMFCGKGPHPKFFGKNFSQHVLSRLDKKVEDLNLTETQKIEYEKIRLEVKEKMTWAMKKRKENFIQLHNQINKEKPDMNAIAEAAKKQLNKMPVFMADNLDLFLKFYHILDEDQKRKVIEIIRKKMKACLS